MSAILGLELPALGTEYEAGNETKDAVAKMVDAFQWMIYTNNQTGVQHWDLVRSHDTVFVVRSLMVTCLMDQSSVGRMISYATVDNQ